MTCPQQSEQLDSYLDGESEPGFTAWFETHQTECARCRSLVHFHRSFKGMLRESMTKELAPDLVRQRLFRALDEAAGVRMAPSLAWSRRPWFKPMLAAASLAAVSTAAWVGLARNSPHPYALAMANDHTRCCREVSQAQSQQTPPQFGSVAPPAPQQNPSQLCKSKLGCEPAVAKFPNLHQCQVKMCPIQEHPALHMIYQDGDKNMVSMFGLPENSQFGSNLPDAANGIQPVMFAANNHNMAAWKKQGWVYSLVAAMPSDRLSQMAEDGSYTAGLNASWLAHNSQQQPYPGPAQVGSFGAPVQPVVWTTP